MLRVIAHRACPRHGPENSLEGIRTAAALGADAVEVDVRVSADGTAVLSHDWSGWRVARWPAPVRWTRSRRLQRLGIPLLTDALGALPAGPAGLGIAIDVKVTAALESTVQAVTRAGLDSSRCAIWVRDTNAVSGVRRGVPGATIGFLGDPETASEVTGYLDAAARAGADEVSVHEQLVTPDVVAGAHGMGLRIYGWVVRRDSLDRVATAGVDGVVTDWPEDAVALAA